MYVSIQGWLTVPEDAKPRVIAAARASVDAEGEQFADGATVADALRSKIGFDLENATLSTDADGTARETWDVFYDEKWLKRDSALLEACAAAGMTGELDFTEDNGRQWREVLTDGSILRVEASIYYPKDPNPDAPTITLTRNQAKAILALIVGERVDGVEDAVALLTAGLNS